MSVKGLVLAATLAAAVGGVAAAHAATGSATYSVTYPAQTLIVTITPNPAMPASCPLAAGTLISTITATGGDGNPVSVSDTNTTDHVLSAATLPANVIAPPSGTPTASCGHTITSTISWSQP